MKTPTLILISGLALVSTCFAVDPPPDGGYPNNNTAEGQDALFSLMSGVNNTAVGFNALYSNTGFDSNTGSGNTAVGASALQANTTGIYNTATGDLALFSNTTGNENTAIGLVALLMNTSGSQNTATGSGALYSNTTGGGNTAEGIDALFYNTTGYANTAVGTAALVNNTTSFHNTAIGDSALYNLSSGSYNIGVGDNVGYFLESGSYNIYIGSAGTDESGVIRIGNKTSQTSAYIAGISGTPLTHGAAVAVGITADGQLGVRASSARFKEAIKPMDKTSEAILGLKPVSFRYKKELDPKGTPQFGLVAEEVAKVNPDLVVTDDQGKPLTVRFEEVNAMLLNEFLKEHKKVEAQETRLTDQTKEIAELRAALKDVTARLDAKGL